MLCMVSNYDILIDADYDDILKHHKENGNKITVVCSLKNFIIPYGVFKLNEGGQINKIEKKQECSYLINTGMYVLEPEVINDIEYFVGFEPAICSMLSQVHARD